MADVHKSLRLGDLLVEKGLITRLQLREAIEIQQTLQSQRFGNKNVNVRTELGEILIELGFISRHQLRANLNWQRRLKATTAVMVFIAPLLTAACGGGGGGSASASQNPGKTDYPSSLAPANASPKPDSGSGSDSFADQPISSGLTSSGAIPGHAAPPSTVSSSSSSSTANTGVASSASSPASSDVDGSVQLLWNVPSQRENGDYLDITEIGGYELRYRIKGETEYQSIRINDGFTDAYYFNYLKGEYEFQIATFDKEGRFSNFVDIIPS